VANANALEGEAAWKRVGPLYVSRVYAQNKDQHPDVHVYPMRYFYPRHWKGITDPELHTKVTIPGESMLFQYGYTTNKFDKIFAERARARRGTRRNR
jgi:ABC-type Fe3+ transport system substrate-binding protein